MERERGSGSHGPNPVGGLQPFRGSGSRVRIRAKVRQRTDRRFARCELHDVVADLNSVLRAGGYFRYGNSTGKFAAIDSSQRAKREDEARGAKCSCRRSERGQDLAVMLHGRKKAALGGRRRA